MHGLELDELSIELSLQFLQELGVSLLSVFLLLLGFGMLVSDRLIVGRLELVHLGLVVALEVIDLLVVAGVLVSNIFTCVTAYLK